MFRFRYGSDTEKSILIVNLASYLADYMGYGIHDIEGSVLDLDSAKLLEIDAEAIKAIYTETKQRVIGSSDFL